MFLVFLCSSAGKESACNVGDLGSIPVLGRSSGEGKGLLFFSLRIFLLHTKKLHFHCVLHIKKLKHREVKLLAQLFSKWPKWDLNLETLASNSRLLTSFS